MDNFKNKLDKIDNIIGQIKKNDLLKKIDQGDNLSYIIKMNNTDKITLENKLEKIEKFSNKLEEIIKNKPDPKTLDNEIVDFIKYNDFYLKHKK